MHLTQASQPRISGLMLWRSENNCASVLWTMGVVWRPTNCTKCSGVWKQIRMTPQVLMRRDILWKGISFFFFTALDSQRKAPVKAVISPSACMETGLSRVQCAWAVMLWSSQKMAAVRAWACCLKASYRLLKLRLWSYPSPRSTNRPISFCSEENTDLSTQDSNVFLFD